MMGETSKDISQQDAPPRRELAPAKVQCSMDRRVVELTAPDFEAQITAMFARNVRSARSENKRLFGHADGPGRTA
jgi:hypothetical protein